MYWISTVANGGLVTAVACMAMILAPRDLPPDPMKTAAVSSGDVYRVAAVGAQGTCQLTVATPSRDDARAVTASPRCTNAIPALAASARWSEDARGTVTVSDSSGNRLAEFAPGDGLAYESTDHAAPRYTLHVIR